MGNSVANPFKSAINRWFPSKKFQILMLGMSSAGTTTTLYRLRNDNTLDESVMASPNLGFNIVTVPYKKLNFTVWDVSAKDTIRPLWKLFWSIWTQWCLWSIPVTETVSDRHETHSMNCSVTMPVTMVSLFLQSASSSCLPTSRTCPTR